MLPPCTLITRNLDSSFTIHCVELRSCLRHWPAGQSSNCYRLIYAEVCFSISKCYLCIQLIPDLLHLFVLLISFYHNMLSAGRLLTALLCEYFDWAQLSHTLKVYLPECNMVIIHYFISIRCLSISLF